MTYHPTETKPLTHQDLKDFVNWLATKDPNQSYWKGDIHNCLVSQFIKAQGREGVSCGVGTLSFNINNERYHFTIPDQIQLIAYDNFFNSPSAFNVRGEDTFGNALQRAKQLLNMWAT